MGSAPDADLIRRIHREGDREALSLLLERHRGLAYRVALGVLGSPADAEDAAQDAFLCLVAYAGRVRTEGSLAPLVARMALRSAQHLARSLGRQRRREAAVAIPEGAWACEPFEEVAREDAARTVRRAVEQIDPSYRLPIQLHYFEGLSTLETAEALGISHGAARTRLSRALGKLRTHLERSGLALDAGALAALLVARPADAAPPSLAARLQHLAACGPAPRGATTAPALAAAKGLAIGPSPLLGKLAVAGFAAALSLGGFTAVRRLPPPPAAQATSQAPARPGSRSASTRSALPRPPEALGSPASASPPSTSNGAGRRQGTLAPDRPAATRRASTRRPALVANRSVARPRFPQPSPRSPHRAITPSPHHPVTPSPCHPLTLSPPHPLTPAQERQLAIDTLLAAWKESARGAQDAREELLVPLAMADPARAEALAAALPPPARQKAREMAWLGLLRARPRDAVARLADVRPALSTVAWSLGPLTKRDAASARAILDYAVWLLKEVPPDQGNASDRAEVAAIAHRMGDPRAPDLIEAARRRLALLERGARTGRNQAWALASGAQVLAACDPDTALHASELLPDTYGRWRGWRIVVARVARTDVPRAVAMLDARPVPGTEQQQERENWCIAARWVACALAEKDAAGAEALARRIPRPADRAIALAQVARHVTGERSMALFREALELAQEEDPHSATSRTSAVQRVAEMTPPGPERWHAALAILATNTAEGFWPYAAADAAYLLAASDPLAARWVLEDALGNRDGEDALSMPPSEPVPFYLSIAMAAVDPVRAVAMARRIPPDRPHRLDALRRIATYLLTPREERAASTLGRWAGEGDLLGDAEDALW